MSGRGRGRTGRARRSDFMQHVSPHDRRIFTPGDMDISFIVLLKDEDLLHDSELEIPKEHGDLFLEYYQNEFITLSSIHPSKSTQVFLKYDDDWEENYCLSTNWYEFEEDYGLEEGDQVLFELQAIGGGIPPYYKITVMKSDP